MQQPGRRPNDEVKKVKPRKFGGIDDKKDEKSTLQSVKDTVVDTVNAGIEKIKNIASGTNKEENESSDKDIHKK